MTTTLFFPGLGLSFELNRVAVTVFGLSIYWYGIIIGLAFLAATMCYVRRATLFGLDPDRMIDATLVVAMCGVIGARLYYVAFRWGDYAHNLTSIFNLRGGGLAIYGGVIFGILSAWVFCKLRGIKFLPMLDLLASGMLIAQAIGRWGNFVNIEAFGTNTTAPWGMRSPVITSYLTAHQQRLAEAGMIVDPYMPVHPTFLYEFLWNIIGFILISKYIKRRKFDGEIFLLYIGWYGLGRAVIEGLRTDSLMLGGFRISQVLAALCVVASLAALGIIYSRIKRDPEYLKPHDNTAQPADKPASSEPKPPRIYEWRRTAQMGKRPVVKIPRRDARAQMAALRMRKRI